MRLRTGSAPGRPRQTGQTCEFGGAPKSVRQPQKILVAVRSCAWISSPMTASYGTRRAFLNLRFRTGSLDRGRDVVLERLEILGEHLGELRRLLVVLRRVGPGTARIEHAVRHARARHRDIEIEDRMLLVLDSIE